MAYHSSISDNTVSYLTQQFPAETPAWLAAFPGELKRICEKWAFTPEGHEPCSRFGAILYGASAQTLLDPAPVPVQPGLPGGAEGR